MILQTRHRVQSALRWSGWNPSRVVSMTRGAVKEKRERGEKNRDGIKVKKKEKRKEREEEF